MNTNKTPSYRELEDIYKKYFSLGYLNTDINTKFALISLICYLTETLRKKKPDVTYYQVIVKISNGILSEDQVNSLSIICSDFSYGCNEFPTFSIPDKDIPAKIREILTNWLPF